MTTTVLPLICHGVPPEGLARNLVGRTVTAYAMPPKHSLEAAWLFTLYFEDGGNLEFWSEFYNTAGWNELGVLVVSSLGEAVEGRSMNLEQFRVEIPSIRIAGCRKLLCEEDGFLAEYGLLLAGEDEENLIIAAGISPGSVSVSRHPTRATSARCSTFPTALGKSWMREALVGQRRSSALRF